MLLASLLNIVVVFVFTTRGILMTAMHIALLAALLAALVVLMLVYLVAVDSIKISVSRHFGFQVALGIGLPFRQQLVRDARGSSGSEREFLSRRLPCQHVPGI